MNIVERFKRRPAETFSVVLGALVGLGFLSADESSGLEEAAGAFAFAVGLVAPIVTAFVARMRGEPKTRTTRVVR